MRHDSRAQERCNRTPKFDAALAGARPVPVLVVDHPDGASCKPATLDTGGYPHVDEADSDTVLPRRWPTARSQPVGSAPAVSVPEERSEERSGERSHAAVLGAAVTFVDREHVLWRVTEHDGRRVPGSRGERCLIFASAWAIRRVWNYPLGWRDLSPADLGVVSWGR